MFIHLLSISDDLSSLQKVVRSTLLTIRRRTKVNRGLRKGIVFFFFFFFWKFGYCQLWALVIDIFLIILHGQCCVPRFDALPSGGEG